MIQEPSIVLAALITSAVKDASPARDLKQIFDAIVQTDTAESLVRPI